MTLSLFFLLTLSLILLASGLLLIVDAFVRIARERWEAPVRRWVQAARAAANLAIGGLRKPLGWKGSWARPHEVLKPKRN